METKEQLLQLCIEKLRYKSVQELREFLGLKQECLDLKKTSNPTQAITFTILSQPLILPEDVLHTMKPQEKNAFLHDAVYTRGLRYQGHQYDIEHFSRTLPFVHVSTKAPHRVTYRSQKKYTIDVCKSWASDVIYQQLLKMQTDYAKSIDDDYDLGVNSVQHVTYCVLIRYNGIYQIYIGQDTTRIRWGRSGKNHLAGVRNALNKKYNTNISSIDLALTYFGPEHAMVFAIQHSSEENALSKKFVLCGKELHLPTNEISLSPIAGAKKKSDRK
jgi:hypothetical protein